MLRLTNQGEDSVYHFKIKKDRTNVNLLRYNLNKQLNRAAMIDSQTVQQKRIK
jgi:hypothetical protein